MIVTGVTGERIGTVERLEIDRTGRLKSLIVRIATAIDSRKRIDATRVRKIEGTVVEVDLTPRDVPALADEHDVVPELPWDEPLPEPAAS